MLVIRWMIHFAGFAKWFEASLEGTGYAVIVSSKYVLSSFILSHLPGEALDYEQNFPHTPARTHTHTHTNAPTHPPTRVQTASLPALS